MAMDEDLEKEMGGARNKKATFVESQKEEEANSSFSKNKEK